ncbi:MAG TPA: chromosome segregation protein SMC [Crenotrichaceae bacterium]|nr:chromosome segregation protein SMC [Crenotrichaceae bacterium]
MRLEKIRLSGFKSFVDPTTVALPGSLICVVGPNGCGKSNIIDAIRWVMGESSAKHLRGGSMTDVIFNGSGSRKPVAMAFVELVFDNSDAAVGGEYAKYTSLAIKRQLSRDGQSLYFLNGSRCRRKDIVDIFLGTGLGPRSYAVIEQGTISRLIEAKPDEMRVFIEEAAGISRYKERRHETEIRMRHTRENLERLIDLRDEVEKQVGHLRRQADKAEKFRTLRDESRLLHKQLLAMRWQEYDKEFQSFEQLIDSAAATVNERMWEKHALDQAIESARSDYKQAQQELNDLQAAYYQASSQVTQTQQAIAHSQSASEKMQQELQQLLESKQQSALESETDESQLQQIHDDRAGFIAELEENLALTEELSELQEAAQQAQSQWNTEWEAVRQQISDKQSQYAICEHTLEKAEETRQQLVLRCDAFKNEYQQAKQNDLSEEIATFSEQCELLEQQQQALHQRLAVLDNDSQQLRKQLLDKQTDLHQYQQQLQTTQGKISSLETLQKNATGEDNQAIDNWLDQQGLGRAPRLATQIDVENGWETAVETVLGHYLEAVCVDNYQQLHDKLPEQQPDPLSLIARSQSRSIDDQNFADLIPLNQKVKSDWAVDTLLNQTYCVADIQEAKAVLSSQQNYLSLITADGLWIGHGWLVQAGNGAKSSGVLVREKQLKELRETLNELSTVIETTEDIIEQTQQKLGSIDQEMTSIRSEDKALTVSLLEQTTQLASKQARQEHIQQRGEQIEIELAETEQQLELIGESQKQQESTRAVLSQELSNLQKQHAELESTREDIMGHAQDTSHSYLNAQETARQLQSQLQMLDSTEQIAHTQMQRSQRIQEQASTRISQLQQSLKDAVEPLKVLNQQLLDNQQLNDSHEQALNERREQLEVLEQKVIDLTTQRSDLEQQANISREKLEQARISQQACQVRRQTVIEQLDALDESATDILSTLPEHAAIKTWETETEQLKTRIDRLGTVNLAAIEEVNAQSERLDFLNQQHDDLQESLNSLEQAISKIDNESKARFRETFDNINQGLQDKFPKLFGGGRAQLDLTDTDLLTAGVRIMAQPPGKRNASIHLLSGGEKALTAVALVFSIFELNPAPFCLLDEVDAPLDDANVGRFGAMLQEMSSSVQFIAISHNKATMEICEQMIGVTMKEAGVSRVVAVDIDEAVEMAVS